MNMQGAIVTFILGVLLGLAVMYAWSFKRDRDVASQVSRQQGAIDVFKKLCPQMLEMYEPKKKS